MEPLFKRLNILKISELFDKPCLKFYDKFCNDMLPVFFNSMYVKTWSYPPTAWYPAVVVVVVVLLFPANNTTMERYSIIQNKLLEATREAIRLIGLVALIMSYKVNKCMWPTGVRGQGSGRGMYHGAKRTCRFRGVGSVLIIIQQISRDWLGLHDRLLRHSLILI